LKVYPNFFSYFKEENIEENFEELKKYSHLLVEAPCTIFENTHRMLEEIDGYGGISLKTHEIFPFFSWIRVHPKLCVLEKNIG
jgi:hypothetical protein